MSCPSQLAATVVDGGRDAADAMTELDTLIVGAGFSGVTALHRVRKAGLKAKIFEAGSDFGGTWYWNRYPGARVDSEFPFYQLNIPEVYSTFHFGDRYPDQYQIRRYFAHLDKVLDLRKDTQFGAHVTDCRWNEDEGRWLVRTEQGHVAKAKYLILGTGLLQKAYIPREYEEELAKFRGAVHHSAAWPDDLDLTGKKVLVVGTGATGVQVVQEMAKVAHQLTVFMRRPSCCLPAGQRKVAESESKWWRVYLDAVFKQARKSVSGFPVSGAPSVGAMDVSAEERERYFEQMWEEGGFRSFLVTYPDVLVSPEANRLAYEFWASKVRARISDPKKKDLMAPPVEKMPFYWGTKRPPLEVDYYEMIDRDNVAVYNVQEEPYLAFNETGVRMGDGTQIELDVVILATGFDSWRGSLINMGLKSREGVQIKDYWSDGIRTYLGMFTHGFPNVLTTYTPHSPSAFANGTTIIEMQVEFALSVIEKLEREGGKYFHVTREAEDEWMGYVDAQNAATLVPETRSWWNGGNVPGLKPQNLIYLLGIEKYEQECRQRLEEWQGFVVAH